MKNEMKNAMKNAMKIKSPNQTHYKQGKFICLSVAAGLMATLFSASFSYAQPYKWTDENGRTVYSDTPPDPKQVKKVTQINAKPSTSSSGEVTTAERTKKSDAAKKTSTETAKKADEDTKIAEDKTAACKSARSNLTVLAAGGRIFTTNDKGEREYMSDQAIADGRVKAEAEVAKACAEK